MNTDTPRTDDKESRIQCDLSSMKLDDWNAAYHEMKEHAQELEGELTTVTEQRDRLAEIYPLLAAAWFYGSWKAETFNERKMQETMEREKWWPWESEDKLLEALQSLNQTEP